MPEIPEIRGGAIDDIDITIKEIRINPIPIFNSSSVNNVISVPPPVTVNIGSPIVDVPGCVEAHEVNENNELEEDDPKGTKVFCDGQMPSFNPIQYEPEQMVFQEEQKLPVTKTDSPKPPEKPEVTPPKTEAPPAATANIECPTKVQQKQEPVGTLVEGFRNKVIGYELIDNTCVQITEPVPLPTQIIAGLPAPGVVVTTGGIAVIATTSALMAKPLADILLKVVKPVVKKVVKKIASIRGKKPKVLSVSERVNEQRDRNHAIMELRQTLKAKTK
ncbi:MAG: hypothetical protein VW454_05455 [Pelagibacteraceae bacterium]